MTRRAELAAGLADIERRILVACDLADRSRDEITLVVVTKSYPVSDIELLVDLGVSDFGESRHPEAGVKAATINDSMGRGPSSHLPLRWHFLGGLQTNKAGAVSGYTDVVHSVDRIKLVNALSRGAEAAGRECECLVQVDFGDEGGRSGVSPAGMLEIAAAIVEARHLTLGGLMTVAPLGEDPAPSFAHLERMSSTLRKSYPKAVIVSAGMSADFEQAIAAGATHLRIGRSILGERPPTG